MHYADTQTWIEKYEPQEFCRLMNRITSLDWINNDTHPSSILTYLGTIHNQFFWLVAI